MAVLVPRIRTIGIRLSEGEYSALEKLCVESGARSISDLAHTAICSLVNHANEKSTLASALSAHSAQVKLMEERLEQLTAEIALLKIGKKPDGISDGGNDDEQHGEQSSPEQPTPPLP